MKKSERSSLLMSSFVKTEGPDSLQGSLTDSLKLSGLPRTPSITPPPFRWSL